MGLRIVSIITILFWFHQVVAQNYTIKGKVTDENSKEALAFVNISLDKSNHGITTNIDGAFTIESDKPINQLVFSYVGYNTKTIEIKSEDFQQEILVRLTRKEIELAEITVRPTENPAHRIIKNVLENRNINNPEKMSSFSYTSYNKMYFTAQPDTSLSRKRPSVQLDTIAQDTSSRFHKFLKRQNLLLMEFVSQRFFKHPDKNNEKIISSKVSGFSDPSFTLLATQMQSFGFYGNMVTLLEKQYLNPISPGSTKKYFFLLEDTFITETYDTLFVISYRPKRGTNFEGLKGVLYINTNRYALQNVIAEPAEDDKRLAIRIQQRYEFIDHKQWFPTQLNTDILFKNSKIKTKREDYYPVGIGKSYLSDIKINPDLSNIKFTNVEVQVADNAHKQPDSTWTAYRQLPLTPKDSATYRIIDSLGRAEKFDQKLKFIEALVSGYIPVGIFNIDYRTIFAYNRYEGFRLGFGMATNHKVASFFTVGGYFAYGFSDKEWKYGSFLQLFPKWESETKLTIRQSKDVTETASCKFFEDKVMTSTEWYRDFLVNQMDKVNEKEVSMSFRTLKYFKVNFYANQSWKQMSDYEFVTNIEGIPTPFNNFHFTEVGIGIKLGFKEKFLLTPSKRKLSLGTEYPMVWFNLKRGLRTLDGEYDYTKYELKISKKLTTRKLGTSQVTLVTGKVDGKIPLCNLYNGHGSYRGFSIETENSFATMRLNEFYSSEFVYLFLKQDFGSLLFSTPNFKPELCLVTDIGYGKLLHKDSHQVKTFKTLDNGFYESGLLINRILNQQFTSFGFGVYYRYGANTYAKIADNFAYKISVIFNL